MGSDPLIGRELPFKTLATPSNSPNVLLGVSELEAGGFEVPALCRGRARPELYGAAVIKVDHEPSQCSGQGMQVCHTWAISSARWGNER